MEVLPRLGTSPSATFFRPSLWIPAAGVWGRLFAVGIGHLADSIQGIGGVGPAIDAGLGSYPAVLIVGPGGPAGGIPHGGAPASHPCGQLGRLLWLQGWV